MKRREAIAGVGGGLVLLGGASVAIRGPPPLERLTGDDDAETAYEPVTLETVETPWQDDATVDVPGEQPTFLKLFSTTCGSCARMLSDVTRAHEQLAHQVRFVSVTTERVGVAGAVTTDDVLEWWSDHGGGEWPIAVDETVTLQTRHAKPVPGAVFFDEQGVERWSHAGTASADELVSAIENAH